MWEKEKRVVELLEERGRRRKQTPNVPKRGNEGGGGSEDLGPRLVMLRRNPTHASKEGQLKRKLLELCGNY